MEKIDNKREVLKDKVVKLVREFMAKEGGITIFDLHALFGLPSPTDDYNEVATALAILPISLMRI